MKSGIAKCTHNNAVIKNVCVFVDFGFMVGNHFSTDKVGNRSWRYTYGNVSSIAYTLIASLGSITR